MALKRRIAGVFVCAGIDSYHHLSVVNRINEMPYEVGFILEVSELKRGLILFIGIMMISATSICSAGWWYDAIHSDRSDSVWVDCWECNGSGRCSECGGSGICSECNGRGKNCSFCVNGDCSECNGRGICNSCGGSGGEWQ